MMRIVAWILGSVATLLGALVLVVTAAVLMLDWNMFRDAVADAASTVLGRDVRLEGLDVDLGWSVTRISVTGLTIANAEWGEAERLAQIGEGEVAIRPWPLLWGRTEIQEIVLRDPVLNLEVDQEHRANWDFGALGGAAQPDSRAEFPVIGKLILRDGAVSYHDRSRKLELDGTIDTGKGGVGGGDQLHLRLDGSLEGKAVMLRFTGGPILELRETQKPYPVDLALEVGDTAVRVTGTIVEPVEMHGFDVTFTVEGPSLAEVFPIFGVPLPPTPPYRLSAAVAHQGATWRLEGLQGRVGDSDLSGSIALDQGQDIPLLKANLVSEKLNLKDIAGLVGGTPREQAPESHAGGLFPDEPIAAERLHAMNMDVTFQGERVVAEDLPIDQLHFRVRVQDGRAEAKPLSLDVAGGTVSGEMALNGREEVPSADADLAFENLDLKPFFQGTEFMQEMGGRFFGHLYVLGVGRTIDEMMASAEGNGWVAIRNGTVSGLIVEAAGLDVVEALGLLIGDDARIGLRCGRLDVAAAEGTIRVDNAVIDTTDSLLVAAGHIDLDQEQFDLQIEARAKDFSLIDMAAPVRVYGSLQSPSFAIGGLDPLPFFEMGEQKDVNCDALLSDRVHVKPADGD